MTTYKRWYDQNETLQDSVRLLEKLSPEVRRMIAAAIVQKLPNLTRPQGHRRGLKQIGADKITGLLKSQQKKRWYDVDPILHQAFNCLYLMDETAREDVSGRMILCIHDLMNLQASTPALLAMQQQRLIHTFFK